MSLKAPQKSDNQLVRLLQISIVIEEVTEARATKHASRTDDIDRGIRAFLEGAAEESTRHQRRLARLVESIDVDTVSFDDIKHTVADQYEADRDFESPLYEQLCNAETAFTLYDDLVQLLEDSNAEFEVDREDTRSVLEDLRREKAQRVRGITELMERHG